MVHIYVLISAIQIQLPEMKAVRSLNYTRWYLHVLKLSSSTKPAAQVHASQAGEPKGERMFPSGVIIYYIYYKCTFILTRWLQNRFASCSQQPSSLHCRNWLRCGTAVIDSQRALNETRPNDNDVCPRWADNLVIWTSSQTIYKKQNIDISYKFQWKKNENRDCVRQFEAIKMAANSVKKSPCLRSNEAKNRKLAIEWYVFIA